MANLDGFLNAPGVLIGEISGGSSTPPVIHPKTITENGTYPAPSGVDGFSPVTVNVPGIVPTGTKNITQNGDYDVTHFSGAHVDVPSVEPTLEYKTVTAPATGTTVVTPGSGYDGLASVTVNPTPTETKTIDENGTYSPSIGKHFSQVTVNVQSTEPTYQEKSVTAPASGTTDVTPDSGYDGLSKVTVSPTPTETKSINANGTYTPSTGKHFSQVTVNVPSDTPETQEKTVSPSTSQQIVEPDAGKLLSKVTVGAIQTETKSATPSESSQSVTPSSGKFLTRVDVDAIPSGYVGSDVPRKSSADLTASGATVNVPAGYYSAPASKAVASGAAGTPTATKGAVSNHQISVTPSVTNTTGYITGGTKTGTPVTVSASELVSGSQTIVSNNTYDVTNLETVVVDVPSDAPVTQEKTVSPSTSEQVVTPDSGKLLSKVTVTAIQTETKSATPSESAQTITPTSGKYLTSVSIGAISTSYVGSGVTRKSAQSYTPGTANQTITANQYLNGAQTILGDANLVASNIKDGVSIFGVTGTYSGGSSSETAHLYVGLQEPSSAEVGDLFIYPHPDTVTAGDDAWYSSSKLVATKSSTSMSSTGISITVYESGTFRFKCAGARTATSGTFTVQLYKGTSPISGAVMTWNSREGTLVADVQCNVNDTINVYARSGSTSNYTIVGQLVACIDRSEV